MRILVTGAAGFLGSKLVAALASQPSLRVSGRPPAPIDEIVAYDVVPPPVGLAPPAASGRARITPLSGDISRLTEVEALFAEPFDLVFHLAAVVSGQAEEDFDLGYRVNMEGTRNLLEACRHRAESHVPADSDRASRAAPVEEGARPPVFIFASSTAAYGGELPARVPDDLRLVPATSYGAQKVIGELLVSDYSRKGFVDGRALRFPTIVVRPGAANRALSSFVSAIVREPLSGREASLPVDEKVAVYILSPALLIRNLIHGAAVSGEELGLDRALTLPGLRVTVGEIIAALREIAGAEVAARIVRRPDPLAARVVAGWPADLAASRARSLGFVADLDIREIIAQFIEEELGGSGRSAVVPR